MGKPGNLRPSLRRNVYFTMKASPGLVKTYGIRSRFGKPKDTWRSTSIRSGTRKRARP